MHQVTFSFFAQINIYMGMECSGQILGELKRFIVQQMIVSITIYKTLYNLFIVLYYINMFCILTKNSKTWLHKISVIKI